MSSKYISLKVLLVPAKQRSLLRINSKVWGVGEGGLLIELCGLQLTGKAPEEFFPIEKVDQWSPCSGVADTAFTTNLQLHFGFKRLLWPAWEADHHL